ncbi:MAG: ABC transporter substrate-binding protein, partial [Paracoccaceae bacterium]
MTHAQPWEDRQIFSPPEGQTQGAIPPLRVLSSTDTSLFAPIIRDFVTRFPGVAVDYMVTGTADIDRVFRANPAGFDVVISSAMDLQIKLTNDGFAKRLPAVEHPDWAQWRQGVFAFTSEPAAIVINRAAFDGHPVPRTRQDLIAALRARPDVFRGRVGTYDVRQSGLGYLFATQDARASETFWRLMEVMGALDVRLYCCSGDMIDDLADGSIAVAYNVLGSYAVARAEASEVLTIIVPNDFATTMMRSALVAKASSEPTLAEGFVRHLIQLQSNGDVKDFPLP